MSTMNHNCSEKGIETCEFRLYIHGDTPRSRQAIAQVEQICKGYLAGRYQLECIDLSKTPERASRDQILATPTLMKANPPQKRILGNFGDEQQVLEVLGLRD
jgi:circadian clock protein KaiB